MGCSINVQPVKPRAIHAINLNAIPKLMEDGSLELPLPEKKHNVRESKPIYLPPLNVPKPKNAFTMDNTENYMWADNGSTVTKSPKSLFAAEISTNYDAKTMENSSLQKALFAMNSKQSLNSRQPLQLPKLTESLH